MELDFEKDPFISDTPVSRKTLLTRLLPSAVKSYGNVLAIAIGILVPLSITTGHMLAFDSLWGAEKQQVNKTNCSCACWDTVFKGPYEYKIAGYKHVYFNVTRNTFKMWVITVIAVVATYDSFKQIVQLILLRQLRGTVCFMFLISVQSNYFAYWVTFNYWNDEFKRQWNHQLFFSLTEIFATVILFQFLDRRKPVQALPMLLVANIALFHITISSSDQFVANVLLRGGEFYQIIRDLLLMTTDLIYLSLSLFEVRAISQANGESFWATIFRKKNIRVLSGLTLGLWIWFVIFL